MASDFEAFDPPADYEFEPEFQTLVPRPIPARVRQGRLGRLRARYQFWCFAAGMALLLLTELPIVQHCAKVILPLAYLAQAGLVLIGLSAFFTVAWPLQQANYRYIRRGIPLVGRVVKLTIAPARFLTNHWLYFALTAVVKYRDPETGEARLHEIKSPEFLADTPDDYTTTFKEGDYITLVYLPGKFPQSLQIFGLLNLVPDLGLERRRSFWSSYRIRWATRIGVLLALTSWNAFAIWYGPYDWRDFVLPVAALGIAFGVVFFLFWRRDSAYNQLFTLFLAILFGGMTALACCASTNAWFDTSPPDFRVVEITKVQVVTRGSVLRLCQVDYSLPDVQEEQSYVTLAENAAAFARAKTAVAEAHAGLFGWPWIKSLRPVAEAK